MDDVISTKDALCPCVDVNYSGVTQGYREVEGKQLIVNGQETGVFFFANTMYGKEKFYKVTCSNGLSLAAPTNGMKTMKSAKFWAYAMWKDFQRIGVDVLTKEFCDAFAAKGSTVDGKTISVLSVQTTYNALMEVSNGAR